MKKLTKEQKKQIDDLYNMTNELTNDMTTNIINKDKEEKSDKRGIYNSAFTVENKAEEIITSFKDFLEKQ